MKYVLKIDKKVTEIRTMLIDDNNDIICSSHMKHRQVSPESRWLEYDPMEIWENTRQVVGDVIQEANHKEIDLKNIGKLNITSLGECIILWDKETGIPIYNAIAWKFEDNINYVDEYIRADGYDTKFRSSDFSDIHAYLSAYEIKWIINNVEGAWEKLLKNEIAAGAMNTWLTWKLTGGKSFVTDTLTAREKLFFKGDNSRWDEGILNRFNISEKILPRVVSIDCLCGITDEEEFFGLKLPIYMKK